MRENQLTGFYMRATLALNGLNDHNKCIRESCPEVFLREYVLKIPEKNACSSLSAKLRCVQKIERDKTRVFES